MTTYEQWVSARTRRVPESEARRVFFLNAGGEIVAWTIRTWENVALKHAILKVAKKRGAV